MECARDPSQEKWERGVPCCGLQVETKMSGGAAGSELEEQFNSKTLME